MGTPLIVSTILKIRNDLKKKEEDLVSLTNS